MDNEKPSTPAGISRREFLQFSAALLALLAGCERLPKAPRIGLALGGGGAKGLAHIPMLSVLDEAKIRPHRIAGTSIGAIIGALYAAGLSGTKIRGLVEQFLIKDTAKELIPLPKSLRWLDFVEPTLGRGGLLDSSDFIAYLGEVLPAKRFRDLKTPLTVVTAELWSGQQVALDKGEILPALQASMALPGIFPPVQLKDRQLVDGGIANPLPFDLLMDDCDLVIAIDVSGSQYNDSKEGLSFIGVLFHSFHTMGQNLVMEKLKQQRPQIYLKPDIQNVRVLEFYKAKQIFAQAQPAANKLKRRLRKYIN